MRKKVAAGFCSLSFIGLLTLVIVSGSLQAQVRKSARPAAYHKYIDPLVDVKDFRTHYYEDGAADASVLFPQSTEEPYPYLDPPGAVVDLVRLGSSGLPLLMDCLSDGRLTNMLFDGNTITRLMRVPVGYVCLDILMGETAGKPSSVPDCADDGLGACMNNGFYFRPDDYYLCSQQNCFLRPWILFVQRRWKTAYIHHLLKVHNPYDLFPAGEYKKFKSSRR